MSTLVLCQHLRWKRRGLRQYARRILRCSEPRSNGGLPTSLPIGLAEPLCQPVSYGFNENLTGNGTTGTLASMNASASTVLLCEVTNANGQFQLDATENVAQGATYISPSVDGIDVNTTTAPTDIVNGTNANDGTGDPNRGITKYATGPMGGTTPVNLTQNFTGQTGRHTDGSNFLAADGHVKWLRGAAVSPGHTALNTTDGQISGPGGTGNNGFIAAGTSNLGNFTLTFSPL